MKLLEHESKVLFARYGIPVPNSGGTIVRLEQLAAALRRLGRGPYILKAQVLAGGRGKAGGIRLAKTAQEAKAAARAMLGMRLVTPQTGPEGIWVRRILVEEPAKIAKEFYLSVAMDRRAGGPVMIASSQGGMEIEEVARENPQAILREPVSPSEGLRDFQARRLGLALGIPGSLLGDFVRTAKAVARVFVELDASLVEINPLAVLQAGRLAALDAKVILDDNALYRHPELRRSDPEASPAERKAKKFGISYVSLDGDIGCMVNGAGLAMATMDIIALAGGRPANFLDVGGGANVDQVKTAFELLLEDRKVKAVLVNIFGGIMKCDVIAQGILEALKKVQLEVPLVVRLEGTRVQEGKQILAKSGLKVIQADDLWDAAQKAVKAAEQRSSG